MPYFAPRSSFASKVSEVQSKLSLGLRVQNKEKNGTTEPRGDLVGLQPPSETPELKTPKPPNREDPFKINPQTPNTQILHPRPQAL